MSDEERAARRAQFAQRLLQEGGAGGASGPTSAAVRDQAVTTQRPAEGGQLETTRQATATGSEVTVNWENITLKDSIEVLCRDLGMEFIISPSVNVSQEVSVRAGDVTRWTTQDKQELFDAILETAGVQKVQRGRVWVFSPSDIRPVVEAFKDSKYGDGKPVIGMIKLKSIDASQAEPFLNTVGGKPQRVFAMKGSRMVLVLGTQQFLTQMEELVKLIDFPPGVLSPYALENASSDDMVKELTAIFNGRTGGDGESIRFTSVARLNVVVALNVSEGMTDEVTKWIKLLDRSDVANERATRVYRLQVIDAETIGKTLASLYSTLYKQTQSDKAAAAKMAAAASKSGANAKKSSDSAPAKAGGSEAAPKANASKADAPAAKSADASSQSSPSMEEEAVILTDKDTNTLIVNATPDQHRDIERTIKELDKPRRQVLIETVLVEMTLSEGMDLGVEWAAAKGISSAGLQSGLNSSITPLSSINPLTPLTPANPLFSTFNPLIDSTPVNNGLSYLLKTSAEKWAFIQAAENDNRLQVLASPTVLTRDGMAATVSFGNEVPVQAQSQTDAGKSNFSYDYHDAKMILTVTPTIDDNKNVTLALSQVQRQVNTDTTKPPGVTSSAPTFTTREISSSLQVASGQTLILGGLIARNDQVIKTGIPLLCRIPYIGWIFGRNKTIKVGTEILMILTPHVVDTRDETDLLTKEFRTKIMGAMSMSAKDTRKLYNLEEPKVSTNALVDTASAEVKKED
ncbi:MAG: secretin N-terminal domain-containing protein [Kiritimatiellales bacterium]